MFISIYICKKKNHGIIPEFKIKFQRRRNLNFNLGGCKNDCVFMGFVRKQY